jgi:hypothetical protein
MMRRTPCLMQKILRKTPDHCSLTFQ